jgi:hypothetical protein
MCHAREETSLTPKIPQMGNGVGRPTFPSKKFIGTLMKLKNVRVDHGHDDVEVLIVTEAAS